MMTILCMCSVTKVICIISLIRGKAGEILAASGSLLIAVNYNKDVFVAVERSDCWEVEIYDSTAWIV